MVKPKDFHRVLSEILQLKLSEFIKKYGVLLPKLTILHEDESVSKIFELVGKGYDYIVVTDDKNRLVGVITYLDILGLLSKRSIIRETAFGGTVHVTMVRRGRVPVNTLAKLRVHRISKRMPPHITSDHTVEEAYNLMEETGSNFLIVVDNQDKPIGVITLHSIFRAVMYSLKQKQSN
ncbi:MAG: CBS domain-containing protein [Thermoprotei archaeon]